MIWFSKRAFALLVLTLASTTLADEPADNPYRFSREISIRTELEQAIVAVELDDSIYEATEGDLDDVRIVDSNGDRIPFLIQKVQVTTPKTVRNSWTVNRIIGTPLPDGGLEIIVQRDEELPSPDGVAIHSPMRNFEHRIRVFVSHDGTSWKPHGKETILFDYSRFLDARSLQIDFPKTDALHFRLIIDDATQVQESERLELTRQFESGSETGRKEKVLLDRRPFRVDRIEFLWTQHQPKVTGSRIRDYRVDAYEIEQDSDTGETVIRIDVPTPPITAFKIQTDRTNFSRHLVVESLRSSAGRESWTQIAQRTISKYDFHHVNRSKLDVPFREHRSSAYRLRIQNRENPPLSVTGVLASGNVYQVVFLYSAKSAYRLVYASRQPHAPDFDTSALQSLMQNGFTPVNATLGHPAMLTVTPTRPTNELLTNSRVMIGTIAVLVVLLTWTLYRTAQRVESLRADDHSN